VVKVHSKLTNSKSNPPSLLPTLLAYPQNSKLATEISLRNAENERMEREIQRMCDTSEELKELERKVRIIEEERRSEATELVLPIYN